MPKIVDKEQIRQEILITSIHAFLNNGIHKTTMDKIAKEAGVAKGTLYLYFKSKNELIETITNQYLDKLYKRIIPEHLSSNPDILLSHIQSSFTISEEERLFIPVIIESFGKSFSTSTSLKKYKQFIMEISEFYEKNLQYLIDLNLINKDLNPKNFSKLIVQMMDGMMFHSCLFETENTNQKERLQDAIQLLENNLKL